MSQVSQRTESHSFHSQIHCSDPYKDGSETETADEFECEEDDYWADWNAVRPDPETFKKQLDKIVSSSVFVTASGRFKIEV